MILEDFPFLESSYSFTFHSVWHNDLRIDQYLGDIHSNYVRPLKGGRKRQNTTKKKKKKKERRKKKKGID